MGALSIVTSRIPPARAGQAYSEQMNLVFGVAPYTWEVAAGFGSLPLGMSLSLAGLLSAAAGAIPATAVGSYPFRLKVTDSDVGPTVVFKDVTIEVVPSGYDRVPGFLLDDQFRSLVSRLPDLPVLRDKVERHFFRDLIGVMGDTYAHYDEDIYCPDWETPGTNISLRDVLDDLDSEVGASVKTINTVVPDPVGDFDLVAGLGVAITPVVNGLQIDAIAASGPIDVKKTEAFVAPGGTVGLTLSTDEFLAQMWVKVNGVYHKVGSVPDMAGKKLEFGLGPAYGIPATLSPPDSARIAMAAGTNGFQSVIHAVGSFNPGPPGELVIARFDGPSMILEETFALSSTVGVPFGEPVVACGRDSLGVQKVAVLWVELAAGLFTLMYAELNPINYALAPFITAINPLIGPPLGQCWPHPQDGAARVMRMFATFDMTGSLFVSMDTDAFGGIRMAQILEVRVGTGVPGPLGVQLTNFIFALPRVGLDLVLDAINNDVYWLNAAHEPVPAGGTMDLYRIKSAFPAAPIVAGPLVIDATAPTGFNYKQGGLSINPAVGEAGVTYVVERSVGSVQVDHLEHVQVTGIAPAFPAGSAAIAIPLTREWNVALPFEARFGRWWTSGLGAGDVAKAFSYFVEPCMSEDRWLVKRQVFDTFGPEQDAEILLNLSRLDAWAGIPAGGDESYLWTRTAATNTMTVCPHGYTPRVLTFLEDDHCFTGLDANFGENFTMEFDPSTLVLTGRNKSPFYWDIALVAEESSVVPPENLLIACYQFSQAMRNYFTATGWYPSPSAVAGVLWTEAQVAGTVVGGFAFSSYYSVTPGQYDLHAGGIAQAWYMADEPATTALDYTLVFRYNYMPTSVLTAEATIAAAIDAFLLATPPLPHGTGVNPNFYTLIELDAILGTIFATTYVGAPYDYYRYFLFTDVTGLLYDHGWYSSNYVDTGVAYGPHPSSSTAIPISEHITVTVPGVANVSDFFTLANSVSAARVYVNGIMYLEGIDWRFSGMNTIEYLNRQPKGYVLNIGDVITVDKYIP